ncbi:hypothetical protein MD484_g2849, partial [Candolleomyces efflorescens]
MMKIPKKKAPNLPPQSSYRKNQKVQGGIGAQFATPKRKRTRERKQIEFSSYTRRQELKYLDARIEELSQPRKEVAEEEWVEEEAEAVASDSDPAPGAPASTTNAVGEQAEEGTHIGDNGVGDPMDVDEVVPPPKPKRLVPDEDAEDLYTRWKSAIPTLVQPFLQYMNFTVGKEWESPPTKLASECTRETCARTDHQLTGLLFGSFQNYSVTACGCQPLIYVLVRNGLFPTAPHSPRWAVSIDLLELFLALADRSSDAVTALAAALNSTYKRRSFVTLTSQGKRVRQPFRRGIGYAMQWYDCLRIESRPIPQALRRGLL